MYVIQRDGKYNKSIKVFLADRAKTKSFWWVYTLTGISMLKVFETKEDANRAASRLKWGNIKVIPLNQAKLIMGYINE